MKSTYCLNVFYYIVIINFLLVSNKILGQKFPDYTIENYTSDDGLPQNSVNDILFDKSGFCWISTEGGLVCFDNKNFKIYGNGNIKGLRSERIFIMRETTAGEIYAQNTNVQDIYIKQDKRNISNPVLYINASFIIHLLGI